MDPEGPQFAIEKGKCLDEKSGEYEGVNNVAVENSEGKYSRIKIHSFMQFPHTSCGCFEVVGFYIPEVDGIGWVDRDFQAAAPNGLTFSTMAGQTGGGKQIEGFLGIGVNYMRSPKFIQADGGWNRVVWMTNNLKEKIKSSVVEEILKRTPSEIDVQDLNSLKGYLSKNNYPIVSTWKKEEEKAEPESTSIPQNAGLMPPKGFPLIPGSIPMPQSFAGGRKIIIKGAKYRLRKLSSRQSENFVFFIFGN